MQVYSTGQIRDLVGLCNSEKKDKKISFTGSSLRFEYTTICLVTVRTVCENDQNVQQGHAFTEVKVEKNDKISRHHRIGKCRKAYLPELASKWVEGLLPRSKHSTVRWSTS